MSPYGHHLSRAVISRRETFALLSSDFRTGQFRKMGGDHHHHAPYKVPDHSIYKIEEIPKLIEHRDKLAKLGLKDPWIRNEAWRYTKDWPTPNQNMRFLMTRGLGIGIGLAVLTAAAEKYLFSDGHDAHHGGGEHH